MEIAILEVILQKHHHAVTLALAKSESALRSKSMMRAAAEERAKMRMSLGREMVGSRRLRAEWRERASEMEAGGSSHLCGDWNTSALDRQRSAG